MLDKVQIYLPMLYPEQVASACKTPSNLAHPIDPILKQLHIPTYTHSYNILRVPNSVYELMRQGGDSGARLCGRFIRVGAIPSRVVVH